jgi:hypothetical protein
MTKGFDLPGCKSCCQHGGHHRCWGEVEVQEVDTDPWDDMGADIERHPNIVVEGLPGYVDCLQPSGSCSAATASAAASCADTRHVC